MKVDKKWKSTAKIAVITFIMFKVFVLIYLFGIPAIVSNPKVADYVSESIEKNFGVKAKIQGVKLKTYLRPKIDFSIKNLAIQNNEDKLLFLKEFDSTISFAKALKKQITVKKLGADLILADVDNLLKLTNKNKKTTQQNKPSNWDIDLLSANLYVKKIFVRYNPTPNVSTIFSGKNIEIKKTDNRKHIHFDLETEIVKNNKSLTFKAKDENRIFIENKKIFVDNFEFKINDSVILINAEADKKHHYLEATSQNFDIKDVVDIVKSDLIINNGSNLLTGIENIDGSFDSQLILDNGKIDGTVNLHKFKCIIQHVKDLPITVAKGSATINNTDILLKDFEGFYGKDTNNKIKMNGGIYDYFNTAKTNIIADTVLSNEFAVNHFSKLVGYPITTIGKGGARIILDMLSSNMDLQVLFKLAKGDDILIDGMSLTPVSYDRAAKAIMHIKDDNINIETINYYIADTLNIGSKVKPILTINGNVSVLGEIRDIGFDIPKPLPSEFLNVFLQGRVFRKGTIAGNLHYINKKEAPIIDGNLEMNEVIIPAQRLFLKEANLKTSNSSILLSANGKYRRTSFDVSGDVKNEIIFPIIVNDINLNIDELNIEQILQSFARQAEYEKKNTKENFIATNENTDIENSSSATFMPGILEIKDCNLNVQKGSYKDVLFSNVKAKLTLSKDGLLKLTSNRFEIAEGISSAKVECDLINQLYKIRLGIKEVNSDTIATSLLALSREITGKASGIIDLYTDRTLKLNGEIKFEVKDGSIQKVGLVEYILKFAALFRNPLAMISPSTFSDFVNIPNGDFERITGVLKLKNNVINSIKIKSYSPQLSAYVVGMYDIEKSDAILRIYTKLSNKKKGVAGFLRNISLNSLANKMSINDRNDSNYYASELSQIPAIEANEEDCQIFLTKVDGDVEHNNFISSLKRIK
ncbi:hypothetical protein IKU74_04705 [bacterium]|nr:hypothetical protein [bacterium]